MTTAASRLNDFSLIAALDDSNSATGNLFWDDGVSVDDSVEHASYLSFDVTFDGAQLTIVSNLEMDKYPQGLKRLLKFFRA
jgi:hypothetical protein